VPTVLRQLSLIIATLAGVVTLLAARAAGVRPAQLGLRSAAAFALFYAGSGLLARGVVALTPDVWSGAKRPRGAAQLGQRLDVTLPAASPSDSGFTPLDPSSLATVGQGGKAAGDAGRGPAGGPAAVARVLTAISQGNQEG
jgi:hypothetical protein